jgi:hypothetical protein
MKQQKRVRCNQQEDKKLYVRELVPCVNSTVSFFVVPGPRARPPKHQTHVGGAGTAGRGAKPQFLRYYHYWSI